MQRSYAILIGGFTMLILGNLIGNAILNLVITFNPNQSSLIKDTNYHLVWWSNSFLFISKLGILVLAWRTCFLYRLEKDQKDSKFMIIHVSLQTKP